MRESSGSQFFKATTGLPSGLEDLVESKFDITFFTIIGVITMLFKVMSVLRLKVGSSWLESASLEFLEKSSANS